MPKKIPEEEIERIKREVDLVALIQSKGIHLKRHGSKDFIGACPFHNDDAAHPNMVITPHKNLFHCMSCGKSGNVIQFVEYYEGISFAHAFELLASGLIKNIVAAKPRVAQSTVPKLPSPVDFDAEDRQLMKQVIDFYHKRLLQCPAALKYLQKRGIHDEEAIKHFNLGYSDRTLGLRLPEKNRKAGEQIRSQLVKLGLYRESGHEHFNGSLVFPVLDEGGNATEIYGRKISHKPYKGMRPHLYLPGPHVGIWNWLCLKSREIILCESLIDALTFWVNGFRNVTSIYGCEGFTNELYEALVAHKTQKVYLAYDRDNGGDRAAIRDAERLQSAGIECFRVKLPANMDVNEYALQVTPADKSLRVLIQSAEWLGKGAHNTHNKNTSSLVDNNKLAANNGAPEVFTVAEKPKAPEQSADPDRATKGKKMEASGDKRSIAPKDIAIANKGDHIEFTIDDRIYRVGGLQKNNSYEVLKITLRLWYDSEYHIDTLDMYQDKQRQRYIDRAAEETQLKHELIKRDLGKLLLKLEQLQDERIQKAMTPQESAYEMTADEEREALNCLKDPKLVERLLIDFEKCGTVGETTNKLTGWFACVSRKLKKPLAVIVQSTSAAGKSTLMEAVLSFLPQEEQIKYSAMTGQSLYYLGESNLKHKVLAIVEEEGAERASYALKLLQSEGELTIASTGKDPNTGRMETQEYHVEGPVMIFLTTTAIDIDEELMNRCLVLTVDEGEGQTARIHALQRQSRTWDGLVAEEQRRSVLKRQQNVQRLLKSYRIINPFANDLTFVAHRTRARRDHEKYLTLIDSVTLAHQHQRKIEKRVIEGRTIEFIRVTLKDIEIANKLAPEVLGRSLDELPPQTRRLLDALKAMVKAGCHKDNVGQSDFRFRRRQVCKETGWSLTQVKVHLDRLAELEYVASWSSGMGRPFEYVLLIDVNEPNEKFMIGLLDVEQLKNTERSDTSTSDRENNKHNYPDELTGESGRLSA